MHSVAARYLAGVTVATAATILTGANISASSSATVGVEQSTVRTASCQGAGGQTIACSHDGNKWFSTGGNTNEGCYAAPMSEQPDAGDPYWPAGHGPKDGVLYWCNYTSTGAPYWGPGAVFFVPRNQAG